MYDKINNRYVYLPLCVPGYYYEIQLDVSLSYITYINNQNDEIYSGKIFIELYAVNPQEEGNYNALTLLSQISKTKYASQPLQVNEMITVQIPSGYPLIMLSVNGSFEYRFYTKSYIAEINIRLKGEKNSSEIEIPMPINSINDELGHIVNFKDLLRGRKAYDFIRGLLVNSGALIDKKNENINVYTFGDVVGNTSLDWSDKLISIAEEKVFNDDMGARNYVKYKDSDKYNGYGDGFFANELATELEKEDKDIITNGFFSFVNGVIQRDFGFIFPWLGVIPMYKKGEKGVEFTGDNGFWLVKLGKLINYPLINDDIKAVEGARYVYDVEKVQPIFDNIRETNWGSFISMNNGYRKCKAVFYLSPQDIAELDFMRPIYLRQYAQSYILTRVDYQPYASRVEMLLIR